MSGASLYRALVHAGAPEAEAKEAADNIDNTIEAIDGRLSGLEIMVAEIRVTNRNPDCAADRRFDQVIFLKNG